MQIEMGKDKTKKMKRVLRYTAFTEIPGLERVDSIGEIPEDSPLAKEIDMITDAVFTEKKKAIAASNKKKLASKRSTDAVRINKK